MAAEAEQGLPPHYAEVPAHKDPNRDAGDFAYLNRTLRACHVCRLVKSERQFMEAGCDNCTWLGIEEDRDRLHQCTTPNFSGMSSVMDPQNSWVAKWTHLSKYVPGCYALVINDEMPRRLRENLQMKGIRVTRD